MEITLKDKNGVLLYTEKKYCKENIQIIPETENIEINPSTEEQVFISEKVGYSEVKIKGVTSEIDENIKPENIKVGTTILGIEGGYEGIDTSDATATASDILKDKTAYVNGEKIVGTYGEEYIEGTGIRLMESEYKTTTDVTYVLGAFRANKLDYTRDKISSITFLNDGAIPESFVDSWDVSFDEDGTVTAYVCTDTNNADKYHMFVIVNNSRLVMPENCNYYFCGYENCNKIVGLELLDTSNVTNMRWMFGQCQKLEALDVHTFNTSKVTNMNAMFYLCKNASMINVTGFDTSNVTNMAWMFGSCDSIASVDASSFDTSNVEDMSYMFYGYYYALAINLRNATFKKVTTFSEMFSPHNRLSDLPGMRVYVKDQEAYNWITIYAGYTGDVYII